MRRLILLSLLAAACGPLPAAPVKADGGTTMLVNTDTSEEYLDDQGGEPGGNLPLGYYARQCQWDACGGPLPTDRTGLAEDDRGIQR